MNAGRVWVLPGSTAKMGEGMQDDSGYVSTWEPKTSLAVEPLMPGPAPTPQLMMRCG